MPANRPTASAANRHNNGNVGVYATVEQPGIVRVGDRVEIVG